jgi:catechol 2,3-dioxygenase-like lactoylglutathione lyase family enzyme
MLKTITPFFIVDDLAATLEFYRSKLGFELLYKGGSDGTDDDYWAMVARDQVTLFLKCITPDIHPQPSSSRHEWVAWDAYVFTDDPDSLYREFVDRGVPMHRELGNNSDNLRAFEVADNNGYVLCFGRPIEAATP